ncbi:hypothetical protein CA13_13900 [Planctomycetes bacterium CA13]|uniref:Uncharacterized protein n=1 Tax=Novipirellula herctigrandis TaxID=2527986 RepID=A0A5C5YY12_9BACT|nr:hypothetical protein CA13_13900 [Planctomycetes bacterium CA13]
MTSPTPDFSPDSPSVREAAVFDKLRGTSESPSKMLALMVEHFRQSRQPVELFEGLKMQIRDHLGLPLLVTEHDKPKPEEVERQLEAGLLEACTEVGQMLIDDGKVAEGWMYLRPTGDVELARKSIAKIPITEENYDAMIQVLLHEGLDVGRGFAAVLEHQGTCNSITLYEQAVASRGKADRQAAAARLLDHLYNELVVLVRGDIARRESPAGEDETLSQMLQTRPWIMDEGAYHLDTTHLASTVRIASVLDDPSQHQKARDLCQYGRRLSAQYQYPGEEPFVDFYPAYNTFYSTLLGEDTEAGLKWFERKARAVDTKQFGASAIETYVDLLDRVGQHGKAVKVAVELVPDDMPSQRIVPLLLDIASRDAASRDAASRDAASRDAASRDAASDADSTKKLDVYQTILDYCRRHNDVLGYTAALHDIR